MTNKQKGFTPLHLEGSLFGRMRNALKRLSQRSGTIRNGLADVTGFTLVEMAVSLVLASLMMIALTGTFILQSRAYTATRMSTELQNNARTALDTIGIMLKNAGLGITKSDSFLGNVATKPPYDSAAFCFYTPNNTLSQYVCNYMDPAGTGDSYETASVDGTQCVNNGWNITCPPHGTDSLTFAYRETGFLGTNLVVDQNATPPTITYANTYPYFSISPGDVGFLIDANHVLSALVTLDGNAPAQTGTYKIPVNKDQSFFNELDTLANDQNGGVSLFNNGYFQKVDVVHVYVDYTYDSHPALMMQINGNQAIPLADNIEDFQVQFIMDDSNLETNYNVMGSGTINGVNGVAGFPLFTNNYFDPTLTDPNVYPAANPQQNPMNINAVVLTIVARADAPSTSIAVPPLQEIADHDTNNIPYPNLNNTLNNYPREVYQEIIQLPNIRVASQLYDNRAY